MANGDDTISVPDTHTSLATYHGRDFQQYAVENGIYFAPVDEDEGDRLRQMHEVFKIMFDNRLIFPPIPPHRLKSVLDCGYGTGSWILDVAAHPAYHPDEIIGIDISSHLAPEIWEDSNVYLLMDNLNDRNRFDLVNSQMMAGGIDTNRWPNYVRDILRVLKPGGWAQLVEVYFNAQSSNDTIHHQHGLRRWSRRYLETLQQRNKDPRIAMRLSNMMRDAGFREVESQSLTMPMCPWSNNPRERAIGEASQPNVQSLLSALALYPFTVLRDMSVTDFQLLVAQARREAENPAFKPYFTVYVCVGRKSRH